MYRFSPPITDRVLPPKKSPFKISLFNLDAFFDDTHAIVAHYSNFQAIKWDPPLQLYTKEIFHV
jgi:hypothetical protein